MAWGVAIVTGTAAAWAVDSRMTTVDRERDPMVAVRVATARIPRGTLLGAAALDELTVVKRVPRAFAPADRVGEEGGLDGARTSVDLEPGAFLTGSVLAIEGDEAVPRFRMRADERAVTVAATIGPDGGQVVPGDRVDVLAAGVGGAATVELIVEGAEVLDATAGTGGAGGAAPRARLTLRVSSRQAAELVRAEAFAKEVRALLRR